MKFYHNPRCRKSREALQLLTHKGLSFEVIEYLEIPPTSKELRSVIETLGLKPFDLVRKNERLFKDSYADKELSDEEWLFVMVNHPKLIERPIFINGAKGIVGRPPEKVLEIL